MHYGTETFSVGGEERPTMTRRHSDCDLRWVGAAFDMRHGSEVVFYPPPHYPRDCHQHHPHRNCHQRCCYCHQNQDQVASPSDWELLRKIGARLCKTTTNPTTTTKTTTNPTPTTTKTTTTNNPIIMISNATLTASTTKGPTTSTVQTTADSFEKTTKPTSSKVAKKHVKSVWRPLSKGKKKTKPKVIRRPA